MGVLWRWKELFLTQSGWQPGPWHEKKANMVDPPTGTLLTIQVGEGDSVYCGFDHSADEVFRSADEKAVKRALKRHGMHRDAKPRREWFE